MYSCLRNDFKIGMQARFCNQFQRQTDVYIARQTGLRNETFSWLSTELSNHRTCFLVTLRTRCSLRRRAEYWPLECKPECCSYCLSELALLLMADRVSWTLLCASRLLDWRTANADDKAQCAATLDTELSLHRNYTHKFKLIESRTKLLNFNHSRWLNTSALSIHLWSCQIKKQNPALRY